MITVVVDPAHGGADSGARGPSGVNEKDLVLTIARALRTQLTQQGFRVVMTRDGDNNPTYDERAGIANAIRDGIFITLHASSIGPTGTARTYYYQFPSSFVFLTPEGKGTSTANPRAASLASNSLVTWREAQRPFVDTSHRLADFVQMQLAQQFSGSQGIAEAAAVRQLRSVAVPAVAVEVSSVAATNPASIATMAAPLSVAVAKGVSNFRLTQPPPTNANSTLGEAR